MRTIAAPLLAHFLSGTHRIAHGIRIERRDGLVFGLTDSDMSATIDSVVYDSRPGFELTSLVSNAGLAVDNAEATFLPDVSIFTRLDILAGRWDGASFVIFQYDWKNPGDGVHILKAGWLGNLKPRRQAFVTELRDLRQPLQFNATRVTQPTCPYRLGSTGHPHGFCMVDLEPFTFTGTVGTVASQYQFTDAGLVQADDYFGNGELTWLTGLNAGISAKVRAFAVGGIVTFELPMVFPIDDGDAFSIVAGCRKRFAEDCRDKLGNQLNFGGQKDRPNPDESLRPTTEDE